MPLLLVQSFVNTSESESGRDLLVEVSSAREWLVDAGLLGSAGRLSEGELEELRAVREAIRALLVANGGGPQPSPADTAALRALGRATWIRPELGNDGQIELEPEGGGDGLQLGRLLLAIRDAQRDGTWARLKACSDPDCRWAFYDRSHARRGTWCDMAVCGNRAKNRTLRSRRAGTSNPTPSN